MRATPLVWAIALGSLLLGILPSSGYGQSPSPTNTPSTGGAPVGNSSSAGGAAQADFDSLMELIRSTIEPDTWVDNGGSSRMQPYAGGIKFDAKSVALDSQKRAVANDAARAAQRMAEQNSKRNVAPTATTESWNTGSEMRCVSLHALQAALAKRIEQQLPPDEAMINLAGITRLYGAMVDQDRSDVILVGSVGELDRHKLHGWIDQSTGRPTLRLEDLTAMLNAVNNDQAIGCSIDPTPSGLAAVQNVANDLRSGKIKGTTANDALAKALGPQVITLFGVQPDDPGSIPLIAADRHMKMLALNQAKLPVKLDHYFSLVEKTLDQQGLPDGQLLRFWFTGNPVPIGTSGDGLGWVWSQTPIRLLSEREMADANGQRQIVGQDPRAEAFAKQLTERFNELPRVEPIYGRLAGLFELGLGLALANHSYSSPPQWQAATGILSAADSWQPRLLQPPKFVPSLVASHQIKRGSKRHTITVISGGVEYRPKQLISTSKHKQESRVDQMQLRNQQHQKALDWWWDLDR